MAATTTVNKTQKTNCSLVRLGCAVAATSCWSCDKSRPRVAGSISMHVLAKLSPTIPTFHLIGGIFSSEQRDALRHSYHHMASCPICNNASSTGTWPNLSQQNLSETKFVWKPAGEEVLMCVQTEGPLVAGHGVCRTNHATPLDCKPSIFGHLEVEAKETA